MKEKGVSGGSGDSCYYIVKVSGRGTSPFGANKSYGRIERDEIEEEQGEECKLNERVSAQGSWGR